MSTTIYWKKVKNEGTEVGAGAFKDIICSKFGCPAILTEKDIDYLEGVKDGGFYSEEAQILINAINNNGEIEIFLG